VPADSPTIRQRLEYAGLVAAIWCVGRLPLPALRPLARLLGAIVYFCDPRGRAVALANLQSAFGGTLTPGRRRAISLASYQHFARTMLELFWSPNLDADAVAKISRIEDRGNNLRPDLDEAIICFCLHYSNFEWLSLFTAFHAGPSHVVTQSFKNPLLGRLFDRLRRSTGHEVIPQERSMIRMFKVLKRGGKFQLVVDLNLDPDEGSVIIDQFGGLKTSVTQMHAALALRTGARIVPGVCRPLADGSYSMVFHEAIAYGPDATATEIVQAGWDILETAIREQPECWLWSYKHWRFKPSDDASGRYPFYANTAKRFDRMLANAEERHPGR